MSDIQRYSPAVSRIPVSCEAEGYCCLDDSGEYVLYTDHIRTIAALEAENRRYGRRAIADSERIAALRIALKNSSAVIESLDAYSVYMEVRKQARAALEANNPTPSQPEEGL